MVGNRWVGGGGRSRKDGKGNHDLFSLVVKYSFQVWKSFKIVWLVSSSTIRMTSLPASPYLFVFFQLKYLLVSTGEGNIYCPKVLLYSQPEQPTKSISIIVATEQTGLWKQVRLAREPNYHLNQMKVIGWNWILDYLVFLNWNILTFSLNTISIL